MKMKKVLLFIVSLFFLQQLFAGEEHKLSKVPKDFLGTYIPVQLENLTNEYMNYQKALNVIAETNYDILSLREDICYTQERFYDGYAVKADDFKNWMFINKGEDKLIIDENNNTYRRLTKNVGEEGYAAFSERILSIIFQDAVHNKNISIKGEEVTIYGKKYTLNLDCLYINDDFALYMDDEKGRCILKIEGLGAKIYRVVPGEMKWEFKCSDEVLQEIPLFYCGGSDYLTNKISDPEEFKPSKYRDSKKDLRLLRNLIYAKHGYIFKSEDLNNIFSEFDWYKENPNFSEAEFTNYEKNTIKDIRYWEEK